MSPETGVGLRWTSTDPSDRVANVFRLRRPGDAELARIAAEQHRNQVTYPEVGASAGSDLPAGYAHDRATVVLGTGQAVFDRAVAALRDWQPQRGSDFSVAATGPIAEGATVALAVRLPLAYAVVTGRVVYVEDDADRFAFAYGTLPIHPEQGEERFAVERTGDEVTFGIVAFSRLANPILRIGTPVARVLQHRAARSYLDAMTRAIA
jgi:uncharacterized protein (UPF0548 family)